MKILKNNKRSGIFSFFFLALVTSFLFFSCPGQPKAVKYNDNVIVLFTNDINCAISNKEQTYSYYDYGATDSTTKTITCLGYSKIKALKDYYLESGSNVALVDNGNFAFGDGNGSLVSQTSQGSVIINMLNYAGYDYVGVGNREFQFGVNRLAEYMKNADFEFLSCNITSKQNKTAKQLSRLNNSFSIMSFGDTQVAFIGVTGSETENAGMLGDYTVIVNSQLDTLTERIQMQINSAIAKMKSINKDSRKYVILLSHLGGSSDSNNKNSVKYVVEKLENVTAVLDGYTPTADPNVVNNTLKDKNGSDVYYGHCNRYGEKIGKLFIDVEGAKTKSNLDNPEISIEYVDDSDIVFPDSNFNKIIDETISDVDEKLALKVGSTIQDISRFGIPLDIKSADRSIVTVFLQKCFKQ